MPYGRLTRPYFKLRTCPVSTFDVCTVTCDFRYMTERQTAAFKGVEFIQANLTREASIDKAFTRDSASFDYVFNCAGLTTYGQDVSVYKESVFDLSIKCATAAAQRGCQRFIELSTAQVYAADKVP